MLHYKEQEFLNNNNIKLWSKEEREKALTDPKYKATNIVWCNNRYGAIEKIGHVMRLIKECKPVSLENWQDQYFYSGYQAHHLKGAIDMSNKQWADNEITQINISHGKSVQDIFYMAKQFKNDLADIGINCSMEEAFNYFVIRTIDQTWNGYNRELTAEKVLNNLCQNKNCYVVDTSADVDIGYGIDYEIRDCDNDNIIAAVQVKSESFKYAADSNQNEEVNNYLPHLSKKHQAYKRRYNIRPVFMFIDNRSLVVNPEILDVITNSIDNYRLKNKEESLILQYFQLEKQKQEINNKQAEIMNNLSVGSQKPLDALINSCLNNKPQACSKKSIDKDKDKDDCR